MPSAFFAQLALDATAAVDEVTAEAWLLKPQARPDPTGPIVPDTTRPEVLVFGTYADPEAKPVEPNSYDRRQARRPGLESGTPRLIVSSAALATAAALAGAPVAIVEGDQLVRQADSITWGVATAFDMAGGSLKLGINLVG